MLGFIGGTGPEGRGLALRFALAGEDVLIGSRDAGRADEAAAEVSAHDLKGSVDSGLNVDVARRADILLVTVPYAGHRETLTALKEPLAGKLVVDVVAPLAFREGRARAVAVEEGSVALQAQAVLTESTVVAAFQTISARDLLVPDRAIDGDVVVCADDVGAKKTVMALAEEIDSLRAVDGGGLDNARYVEDFTALLLNINRIYKAHSSLKIAGI
ncbi:MAG: NADPH-dependent F420 reductase [Chloroflexi bacterium]|nr:NADPH-dependent F420 reductase [Chloroflexota bacterium]